MTAANLPRSDARVTDETRKGHGAWIIVMTKRMQETTVKERLERKGFEVYCPMLLVDHPKRGVVPKPFFPSMLFARATLDAERWQDIFTTPGIARVLCSPSRPMGVRDEFLDIFRKRERKGYLHLIPRPEGLIERLYPRDKRFRKIRSQDDVADLLQSEVIDDRRAGLLASVTGDSQMRVTVDLRKAAAGGGI